jgi:hypothetical protein
LKFKDDPRPFFAILDPRLPPVEGITAADKQRAKATLDLVTEIKKTPVANPLEIQYFGAAPFLFGKDHVMRFSVQPWGGEKPQVPPAKPSANYLAQAVTRTMRGYEPICFDFMVQVRKANERGLNIEDATTHWDAKKFPFINVARVVIPTPQKNLNSSRAKAECEKRVFTPWHALPAHQPLGGINRLRKAVYLASKYHRGIVKRKPRRKTR